MQNYEEGMAGGGREWGRCGGGGGGDVLPLLRYAHASARARVRVQVCLEEGTVVEIEARQMAAAFKLSQQVGT